MGSKRPRSDVPDEIVKLNVGGASFSCTSSTLLSEASRLADDYLGQFASNMKDSNGVPFYDRDGETFRHVMCYLRGYPLRLRPTDVALLAEEANFFGIHGLRVLTGALPSEDSSTFVPGAGVRSDGRAAQSSKLTALVGRPIEAREKAQVTIRLEKATHVCIGLVPEDTQLDGDIFGIPHSVVYGSDGHLCCALGFGDTLAHQSDFPSEARLESSPQEDSSAPLEESVAATRGPLGITNPQLFAQAQLIAEAAQTRSTATSSWGTVTEFSKVPYHMTVAGSKSDDELSFIVSIADRYSTASFEVYKGLNRLAAVNVTLSDSKISKAFNGRLQLAVHIQSGSTVSLKPCTFIPANAGDQITTNAL